MFGQAIISFTWRTIVKYWGPCVSRFILFCTKLFKCMQFMWNEHKGYWNEHILWEMSIRSLEMSLNTLKVVLHTLKPFGISSKYILQLLIQLCIKSPSFFHILNANPANFSPCLYQFKHCYNIFSVYATNTFLLCKHVLTLQTHHNNTSC